jgi:hypothetical protein
LFLVVILVLPIWVLLFNMGYAGARLRNAQTAARLSAYEVLERRTAGDEVSGASTGIADSVAGRVFPGETNPVQLSITDGNFLNDANSGSGGALDYLSGMLASLSGNMTVEVTVDRKSPFEEFANSEVSVPLTTGGTPLTYCEMDNTEFDPFAAEGSSGIGLQILSKIPGVTSFILSPFGGLAFGSDKC